MNYETIKSDYEWGLWTAAMVAMAVRKGVLTREQYQKIVGRSYPA